METRDHIATLARWWRRSKLIPPRLLVRATPPYGSRPPKAPRKKAHLEEASKDEEEAQHIEIWDHLADCMMALGDAKGAIDTWTKALKFEDVSKRVVERRKKVTQKLQKAKASLKKDDKKEEEKKDDKKEEKKEDKKDK